MLKPPYITGIRYNYFYKSEVKNDLLDVVCKQARDYEDVIEISLRLDLELLREAFGEPRIYSRMPLTH